jgi:hypothetical protein
MMQKELSQGGAVEPLTVTVAKACQLSGFDPTSIWAFLKDRPLQAVRINGVATLARQSKRGGKLTWC